MCLPISVQVSLLATEAFTQVGGTSFTEDPRVPQLIDDYYWSSSEAGNSYYSPCSILAVLNGFRWWHAGYKGYITGSTLFHVRSFIHYDE